MTEKLGVLLVDLPEPRMWEYSYIELNEDRGRFSIENTNIVSVVPVFGYKCTQEEAKNTHSLDGCPWRNYESK